MPGDGKAESGATVSTCRGRLRLGERLEQPVHLPFRHADPGIADLENHLVRAGVPIHLQGAFSYLGHEPGDFPVSERAAEEVLSLPLFPGIREDQQSKVVEELRKALG